MNAETRSTALRLGVALSGARVQVALVDGGGCLVMSHHASSVGDTMADLRTALSVPTEAPVRAVMLATDHIQAATSRGAELARVGALRIGAPVATAVPVLAGWPSELRTRIVPETCVVGGAHDLGGRRLSPFDAEAVAAFCRSIRGRVDGMAVSGVFAPLVPEDEVRAAEIIRDVLGADIPVTMSHTVGGFGLLDRENAAVLNAALIPVISELLRSALAIITERGWDAELFVVQNDGTLVGADAAGSTPIHLLDGSFAAGVHGAGRLASAADAIVLSGSPDSARAGILRNGSVVVAPGPSRFAGVRMNIELPVGSGRSPVTADAALAAARGHAAGAPVLSLMPGAATGTPVPSADVAMAVGAADAPVSVTVWQVIRDGESERARLISARRRAIDLAIAAGADPVATEVVDLDEVDLSQMTDIAKRIRIRAAGRPLLLADAEEPDRLPAVGETAQHT